MKRILSISMDRSIADSASAAADRQRAYYAGWEVDIVIVAEGASKDLELSSGIRVHVPGGSTKFHALRNAYRLARRLANEKHPDLVTAQDPLWSGRIAASAVKVSGAALHIQDHSGFFARRPFGLMEKILTRSAQRLVRRADRIRTVSERGANGLVKTGIDRNGIDVIPIATDVARFSELSQPDMSASHVLCIARLEQEKGVDVLLRAWEKVLRSVPDASLRIVGNGSQRDALNQQATSLGIQDSVEFVSGQTDVAPHFAWSSIVVQPSQFEGWGLAVSEAAAAGRPVVMTDVGCAGEVIQNGVSGIVVPVGDDAALANGIIKLLRYPEVASSYGIAARATTRQLPTPAETIERIRRSFERTTRVSGMLVVAQAVDADDALFGFFVSWLAEAAKKFGGITVLALRVGRHDLPSNVKVIPLRPRGSRSRFAVVWNLLASSWRLRDRYTGVYVRGDVQYVVLAGWLWRLLGKRVILFYAHYTSRTPWLRPATWFCNEVVTSVRSANALASALPIGQAVDAERFGKMRGHASVQGSGLIFGRVSPVKRVPWILEGIEKVSPETAKRISVVGRTTDADEAARLSTVIERLGATWEDRDVRNEDAPALYHTYDVYLNATPGSLDKTIVEAMMSGLVVVASTDGYGEMLPPDLAWLNPSDAEFGESAVRAMGLSVAERHSISHTLREIAMDRHSQYGQIAKLHRLFKDGTL